MRTIISKLKAAAAHMAERKAQRAQEALQREYDALNFKEAFRRITHKERTRLDELRPQFDVKLVRDSRGRVVAAFGTREGQLDSCIKDLIGKITKRTATKTDHELFKQYQIERARRMGSRPQALGRFEKLLAEPAFR